MKCSAGGPFGPCAPKYPYEAEVTLLAEAGEESELTAWSGACEYAEAEEECELTIEEETTVTATFDLQPKLKIEKNGAGTVECEVEGYLGEPCEPRYPRGTELVLVAEPEEGSEFLAWEGECDRIAGSECELEMNADRTVRATFDSIAHTHTLTIVKAGAGTGAVTCNGGPCATSYAAGTEVTLVASAASGSAFAGWSAGAGSATGCSGAGVSCSFEIEADSSVTAVFNPAAKPDPPPAETCATNPALCLLRPAEGTARAAGSASVSGGKAALRLTCSGGPCSGSLTLTAKVRQGAKTKSLAIGRASFGLASGASATLKVKLSGPAKQELAEGKALTAKLSGSGVIASTVKLKPAGR